MITIKILGPGCENCDKLVAETQEAVSYFGVDAEIIKITNPADIQKYNVFMTPGLVINERLVSTGRIPSQGEIISWMADEMEKA